MVPGVVEVVGESGVGKTQLGIQFLLGCLLGVFLFGFLDFDLVSWLLLTFSSFFLPPSSPLFAQQMKNYLQFIFALRPSHSKESNKFLTPYLPPPPPLFLIEHLSRFVVNFY